MTSSNTCAPTPDKATNLTLRNTLMAEARELKIIPVMPVDEARNRKTYPTLSLKSVMNSMS